MKTISEEELRTMLVTLAKCKGVALNPDEKQLSNTIKGLLKNIKEKGFPYCPCRKIAQEPFQEFACPCIYMIEDVRRHGKCLCGLFVKK